MALRGTLTHRKTRRLGKILGISPVFALGVLEALWHVTAEQHPDGALGSMTNLDIAEEMFYDDDPDKLISALIESGWLDEHPKHRLIVHDWQDHADQSVKRKIARHGKGFVSDDYPCLVMSSQELDMPSSPVPESRVQSPEPVPVPSRSAQFVKPTSAQVREYMTERGFPNPSLDSEGFIAHYAGKGWKVGKEPMRDWKACVITFEVRLKRENKWEVRNQAIPLHLQ